MFIDIFQTAQELFIAGGWVMWPLAVISLLSVTLSAERAIYWLWTDRPGRSRWLRRLSNRLRKGDAVSARAIIAKDGSVYSSIASGLLDRGANEYAAMELIETSRRSIERFSHILSTIITASPLLGILGTVTGIIHSFQLLGISSAGSGSAVTDPTMIASGIAEALITTAFGLIIAMATLFPFAMYRAGIDRCLGRLESIAAAAAQGEQAARASNQTASKPAINQTDAA